MPKIAAYVSLVKTFQALNVSAWVRRERVIARLNTTTGTIPANNGTVTVGITDHRPRLESLGTVIADGYA